MFIYIKKYIIIIYNKKINTMSFLVKDLAKPHSETSNPLDYEETFIEIEEYIKENLSNFSEEDQYKLKKYAIERKLKNMMLYKKEYNEQIEK